MVPVSPPGGLTATMKQNSPNDDISEKEYNTEVEELDTSRWQRFKDSFKGADLSHLKKDCLTHVERAALATANDPLTRRLKSRHLQMIAIGGSIGTGLFVGSGSTLHSGGPAALVIGYSIIGIMLYCTVQALGELAVTFPVSGAFSTFSTRFIDPAWGFAMGWNYGMEWLCTFPLELVAASITMKYWDLDISPAVWVTIFYVVVLIINLFGVKGYGEAEFAFSIIKVIAVIGFIILGIVINCGGGPHGGYIGDKYWHDPGAFANSFKGVATVFVNAAFAFTGTELVGLAAAETANPRKSLPSATKQVFWRITLFYMISLTVVGFIVPYTDSQLMGSSSVDASASPFVIAIENAGIKVLPTIVNVVILIAVLSVGNSCVYACSRTLVALASQGFAPRPFAFVDRAGRPMVCIAFVMLFGLLSYLAVYPKQDVIFNWLLSLTGLSLIFTWGSICVCHIRFRRALQFQGRTTDELPYTSTVGVIGSWIGLIINCVVLVAQFWIALFPIGEDPNPSTFFQKYLAAPVVLAFYLFWKFYKKTPFVHIQEIDVDTGRRDLDHDLIRQEMAEERERANAKGWWYKVYKFFC